MPKNDREIRAAQLRGGRWGLVAVTPVPLIALFVGNLWENLVIWTAYLALTALVFFGWREVRRG